MGLDIYFSEDISRALAAALAARRKSGDDESYEEGYQDALRAVAANFGISVRRVLKVLEEGDGE